MTNRQTIWRRGRRGACACVPRRLGFSLVEVNLALLVIGLGMLVLFSIFPVSLRQGSVAFRETQAAMYADHLLNGIRGDLLAEDDFGIWSNRLSTLSAGGGSIISVEFPVGSGSIVQYLVEMEPVGDRRWSVDLWVWGEKYGPPDKNVFKRRAEWYYTEFYYTGWQP